MPVVDQGRRSQARAGNTRRLRAWSGVFGAVWLALSCQDDREAAAVRTTLRVATSSSLEQSGLFDAVAARWSKASGRSLQPLFVGTGEALALGRAGKADVVWVHSRPSEDAFVAEGSGVNRREVMHSAYVIVGPRSDPAQIEGQSSVVRALAELRKAGGQFVSRGDASGNHQRELELWKLAGVEPDPTWYTSLGAGMLSVLVHASERGAYALSDLPSFVVNQKGLELKVLVRGDARLRNPYAVIAVNPTRVSDTDYAGAMAFIDFLTSPAGQVLIADFGREKYGAPLFAPLASAKGED